MAKKGQTFKKYSAEFKLCVILDMREHGLSYRETVRKYELGKWTIVKEIDTKKRKRIDKKVDGMWLNA